MSYTIDVALHTKDMPRDSQRSKFYAAERMFEEVLTPTTGMKDSAELVQRICTDYIVPQIGVIFINDRTVIARGSYRQITIPRKKAHSTLTILHETAHGLANWYTLAHDDKEAWHGRTFARIACDLYVRYGKASELLVLHCMKEQRVKLATRVSCKRPPRGHVADYKKAYSWPHHELLAHEWRAKLPPARKRHPGNPNISACLPTTRGITLP